MLIINDFLAAAIENKLDYNATIIKHYTDDRLNSHWIFYYHFEISYKNTIILATFKALESDALDLDTFIKFLNSHIHSFEQLINSHDVESCIEFIFKSLFDRLCDSNLPFFNLPTSKYSFEWDFIQYVIDPYIQKIVTKLGEEASMLDVYSYFFDNYQKDIVKPAFEGYSSQKQFNFLTILEDI